MTVRPVITDLALDRADANLSAAIKRNGVPPCWSDPDAWSDVNRLAIDPKTPVRGCNACPVYAECDARAAFVDARDLAHTVTAGVRYNGAGLPVDAAAEHERQERDRRLLELVELDVA
ncbi:hypothetical protein ACFV9C_44350 [Kribbella sp. NPDC059898]|uniref:hypothetical protein n=1 Tax=Kribbella sp. NPDC059898 TaxID=3346995 RepID=UPI00366595CA